MISPMPAFAIIVLTGALMPSAAQPGAWHERMGERREKIRVAAGSATRVSLTLPVLEPTR